MIEKGPTDISHAASPIGSLTHVSFDDDIYISPSQIETWETCNRKWGIRYVDGVRGAQSPAAALGDRVHQLADAWLRDGTLPDFSTQEGRILEPAIPHLAVPMTAIVEGKVTLDSGHGFKWTGKIDYRQHPDFRPYEHNKLWGDGASNIHLVVDHKTTKNLRYAKSADHLTTKDPQGLLYPLFTARLVKEKTGEWPEWVDMMWSYMLTAGTPKHHPVRCRASVAETRARVENQLVPIGKKMVEVKRTLKQGEANLIPPNLDGCSAFGGCPHRTDGTCTLSLRERTRIAMTGTANLDALLRGVKQKNGDPVDAPPEDAGSGEVEAEEEVTISKTDQILAERLFKSGKEPADTANPGVVAHFNVLKAKAEVEAPKEKKEEEKPSSPAPVVKVVTAPTKTETEAKAEAPAAKTKARGRPKGGAAKKKKAAPSPKNPLDGLKEAVERFEHIEESKPELVEKVDAVISALTDLKAALESL